MMYIHEGQLARLGEAVREFYRHTLTAPPTPQP